MLANPARRTLLQTRLFSAMQQQQATTSPPTAAGFSLDSPIEYRQAPEGSVFSQKQSNIIRPDWDKGNFGVPQEEFVLDCSGAGPEAMVEKARDAFRKHGACLLLNTGLTQAADMGRIAGQILPDQMKYEGGSNPRENVPGGQSSNVYEVGAPASAQLHYHTEMAYVGESTSSLAFMSIEALPNGRGATYITNKKAATAALLETPFGRRLKEKGVCYHRDLTDRRQFEGKIEEGVYNHWQRSFMTEDPQEAQRLAEEKGLRVQWEPETNKMLTRFYISAFEYCPYTDKNLLYSSIADTGLWFDDWPLVQHLPYEERPLRMTFGDDVPFTRDELLEFIDVHDRFGMKIPWQQGDIAVICNHRVAHGRPGIHLESGEKRKLGVMLGAKYQRRGQLESKW